MGSAIVQVIEDDVESFINESTPLTMAGVEAAIHQDFGRHTLRCTGALQMHVRDALLSSEGDSEVMRLPGSPKWTANAIHTWHLWERRTNGAFTGSEVWVKPL